MHASSHSDILEIANHEESWLAATRVQLPSPRSAPGVFEFSLSRQKYTRHRIGTRCTIWMLCPPFTDLEDAHRSFPMTYGFGGAVVFG